MLCVLWSPRDSSKKSLKNLQTISQQSSYLQGIKQEGDENAYERKSDIYKDLVTLLKHHSPHFAEHINKQVL